MIGNDKMVSNCVRGGLDWSLRISSWRGWSRIETHSAEVVESPSLVVFKKSVYVVLRDMVGPNDPEGLFQPKWFCDSMI